MLGANDGIVSTASLVIGVAAATTTRTPSSPPGIAGLVAGAMSMATGEYISVSSQRDAEEADRELEAEALAADRDGELRELAKIYEHRGVEPGLARLVAEQLMAHDELGAHMRDELGITEIATARPFQAAGTSAVAFIVGAILPLIAVMAAPISSRIIVTAIVALVALVGLGALSAFLGGARVDARRGTGRRVVVDRDGDDLRHRPAGPRQRRLTVAQFHFDPTTYLAMIRDELPDYDTLQAEIGRAVSEASTAPTPPRARPRRRNRLHIASRARRAARRPARARRREPEHARRRARGARRPRMSSGS